MLTENLAIPSNELEKKYIQQTPIKHRKRFAQFFTPFPVASFMAKWIAGNKKLKTVLDPAFGLGVFARALREINPNCHIKGLDIDKNILRHAKNIFKNEDQVLINLNDYILNDWDNKYDGIICNPPYLKFHNYDNKSLLAEIEEKLGIKLSGFTNIYTLFLLKSAYQLNKGGRAAYIIPSEFLNSDYGKLVKSYLIKNKLLRYILIFDFKENIFDNALTTSAILLFANDSKKTGVEFINIKKIQDLIDLEVQFQLYPNTKPSNEIPFSKLNCEIKWRAYYQKQNRLQFKNLIPFSDYGKVVRGIATGANDYFTFNLSKANEFRISEKYLLPCIAKSGDSQEAFFTASDFKNLKKNDRPIFLLNATTQSEPFVRKYLEKGVAEGVDKRFLTSCRSPWFALEKRPPSPIWVSVFNRHGLRFIRNEAGIHNLTTFHCIYLNMFSAPKADIFFAYLLTEISKAIFSDNRREYGNGLQKFEPNDINKAMIVDISKIGAQDEQKILNLFYEYRQSAIEKKPNAESLKKINTIFKDNFAI